MKKSTFIFFIICLSAIASNAQPCVFGNIVFSNQSQVNNFKANHSSCTEIQGNVAVIGLVQNLDSLNMITSITGNLHIRNASLLSNINGLTNLLTVGGDLIIENLPILDSLTGLNSLVNIGKDINVIDPLKVLKYKISDLVSLNDVGGDVILSGISDVGNLPLIDSIFGELNLTEYSFTSFPSFQNLKYCRDGIFVGPNPTVTNITSFNALDSTASIDISNMPMLASLNTCNLLTRAGNVSIIGNGLTSLTGFGNLLWCTNLNIFTKLMNDLNQFTSLTRVDNNLTLNGEFQKITSFNQLQFIGDQLSISGNQLISINGFTSVDSISVFNLIDNLYLYNINGFNHPIHFNSVHVYNNPFLSACSVKSLCDVAWANIIPFELHDNDAGCNSILEIRSGCLSPEDTDGDLVIDLIDNCIDSMNFDQADANGDGDGDVCDTNSDTDNDGVFDADDNCITISNFNQSDADSDGEGDVCDGNSDSDNDMVVDSADNCVFFFNSNQADTNNDGEGNVCDFDSDTDGDGIVDAQDNCVDLASSDQADANNDGQGNVCDSDSDTDNDGHFDNADNCVSTANANQNDSNMDGTGDVCDDSDGDGVFDAVDNCPNFGNADQADSNNNGYGDPCEPADQDADGIFDLYDNCITVSNPGQEDCNNNGTGDACEDADTDCDNIPDSIDNCLTLPNPNQHDQNNNGIGDLCEDFPKVGLNTEEPKAELHLSNGSLYIDNSDKGIILRDSLGQCYIVKIVNGLLTSALIPCPQ